VGDGLRRQPPWLKPAIASILPGPCGCLGQGIRKGAEKEKEEGGKKVQTRGICRKQAVVTKDDNLKPHGKF
jgi:hypothetical protein